MVLFLRDDTSQFRVELAVSGVKTAIPDHFEMLFGNVADETFDEINGRDRFFDVFFIAMPIVVKGDHFTIIVINSGSGDDRTTKVTSDVFDHGFGIAEIGFGKNIKSLFVIRIAFCFNFFKGRADPGF